MALAITIIDIIAKFGAIFSAIAVVIGTYIAVKQLEKMRENNNNQLKIVTKEYEYKIKQSTIEYYDLIYKESGPIITEIRMKHGRSVIRLEELIPDSKMQQLVKKYLSIMERFSVGINIGIYDILTLNRLAGTSIIQVYDQLEEYIKYQRTQHFPSLYKDFEILVDRLKEFRPEYTILSAAPLSFEMEIQDSSILGK